MPTAARLIGAITFAALGYFVAGLIIPYFPEGTDVRGFGNITAGIGALCGWVYMGPRAGGGYRAGMSGGLTTLGALVFWALLIQSGIKMVKLSMRKVYDGPGDAVVGTFEIAFDYVLVAAKPDVIFAMIVGAILAGLATEWASHRWN